MIVRNKSSGKTIPNTFSFGYDLANMDEINLVLIATGQPIT
jgi:hypothetical protein